MEGGVIVNSCIGMAAGAAATTMFTLRSVVRGHHVYKQVWTPFIGEELDVRYEQDNPYDRFAVAVTNEDDAIVGRVPKELSTRLFKFLMNGGSVACTITGKRRNRGRGLEVPCDYKCTGSSLAVKKLRALD